ncbi:ParA family protein [Candidatus Woesearchaeota archaeon]|nr:ParA family protein [Candidatus Woesearchaeota archaeon]
MRTISIINQKGGVGKTTTTVNVAAGLSRNGKKVLLLDLDPQGSVASCIKQETSKNLYHFLVEHADLRECINHIGMNLDVINADASLAKAEQILVGEPNRESILARAFEDVTDYDYILLDCPPSLRLLTQNALFFSKEAFIPVSTDVLGYDGLIKMVQIITEFNQVFNHNLKVSKIIPTMFDSRNRICKEMLNRIYAEFSSSLATAPIRVNTKLKEAPRAKASIFTYDPKSSGAEDYWNLVKGIIADEKMYDSRIPKEERKSALRKHFGVRKIQIEEPQQAVEVLVTHKFSKYGWTTF